MNHNTIFLALTSLALIASCGAEEIDELAERESAASGVPPPPTQPPPPTCAPAECFAGPVSASSANTKPAVRAYGNAAPAAELISTGAGAITLSVTASGNDATAVRANANSTNGANVAVYGRASGSSSLGAKLVNTGGGDLIRAFNNESAPPVFRVANDGKLYVGTVQIGKPGSRGDRGVDGDRGPRGPQGDQGLKGEDGFKGFNGPNGGGFTRAICVQESNCISQCGSGILLATAHGRCEISADAGSCAWGGDDGVCCVCSDY